MGKEYLYSVGNVINGLEILELTTYGKQNTKAYKCRCIKCDFGNGKFYYKVTGEYIEDGAYVVTESHLKEGRTCPCCGKVPKVIVPNINSVWALRKDLVPYFINEEDSKKYTPNSGKKIELKCSSCGTKKTMTISHLSRRGFGCSNIECQASKKSNDYLYNVGDIINGLEILEQIRHGKENRKTYKVKCIRCGFGDEQPYYKQNGEYIEDGIYVVGETCLKRGQSCPCCSKYTNVTVPNINSIWVTRKDLVPYFINEKDSKKYTPYSHQQVELKCPSCETKRKMSINHLSHYGFSCLICGDGISYPEKVMGSVLKQLKITYKKEYSPYWCKNKTLNDSITRKYDFYFNYDRTRYIIETHGEQHYKHTGFERNLEQEQFNDKLKKKLALNRGNIREQNYIVIDCRESNIDFIKDNILNSRLNEVFDLSVIDWNKIAKDCEKNLVKEVCDYWNENYKNVTTQDVSDFFDVAKTTVICYLKRGTKLGWLNVPYSGEKEKIKAIKLKQTGINSPQAKKNFIYDKKKKKIMEGTRRQCGEWLLDNNYAGSRSGGENIIYKNKDTDKSYKSFSKKRNQNPIYFYTYELFKTTK